jgi:hypothetical protein
LCKAWFELSTEFKFWVFSPPPPPKKKYLTLLCDKNCRNSWARPIDHAHLANKVSIARHAQRRGWASHLGRIGVVPRCQGLSPPPCRHYAQYIGQREDRPRWNLTKKFANFTFMAWTAPYFSSSLSASSWFVICWKGGDHVTCMHIYRGIVE